MRNPMLLAVFVLMLGMAVCAAAQEQEQPAVDPQMQAMMDAMEKFGIPGPEHQKLQDSVGAWTVESKMWTDPSAPPHVSKGSAVFRMILGGRYLQYDYDGKAENMPFAGYGITGYDRFNKKYRSLWMDTMGTGFYLTEGTCDAAGKVCTETGVWDDPSSSGKIKVRNVSTHVTKDKFIMEMYTAQPDGKDVKTMEMTYTRKK